MSSSGRRLEWSARSWWCALATLVVIALGRVEGLPIWSFWLVAGVGVFAARPRVRTGWPWYAVAVALVVSTGGDFTGRRSQPISEGIDRFCGDMLAMAERVTSDQELRRLFSVSGEALEPDLPFRILRDELGDVSGRTLYLADDFGELVAWAGEQRSYPAGVRPLGQRQWGLVWFTQRVVLWVREPVLIDGRIVGAVTVADSADRVSGQAWGMTARSGEQILLFPTGTERGLPAEPRPGFAFRVETGEVNERSSSPLLILGLVVLAVVSAVARPRWAWLPALAAGVVWSLIAQDFFSLGTAMVVIVGSAALSRAAVDIGGWAGKTIVSTGLLALCVPTFTASNHALASWLPDRLLTPGWPVVWLLASAILASGWPTIGGGSDRSLARRIVIAAGLAAVGLLLEVAHVPVALLRAERTQPVSVPESLPDEARSMLDDGSAALFLDDSAHLLAKSWNLNDWQVPTSVVVLDDEGAIVSIWGDLTPAGDSVALLESYAVPNQEGIVAELWG
ncbi:MAG: hypothetical protein GY906_31530, partial [bacterium]|nr:hypothetical protein [bacterium]